MTANLVGHSDCVNAVAYTPDGRHVVSGSKDGTVRIWRIAEGGEPATLRGHKHQVSLIRFAAHGQRVLSYGRDRRVFLWDAETGAEIANLRAETGLLTVDETPDDDSERESWRDEGREGVRATMSLGEIGALGITDGFFTNDQWHMGPAPEGAGNLPAG